MLVQYSGKSSPGTYRLARVIRVEVDRVDGLVHTCVVMYSLLAELRQQDRDKYKGITRKEVRVPVQRLVLILPVEEAEVKSGEVIEDHEGNDEIKFGDAVVKSYGSCAIIQSEKEEDFVQIEPEGTFKKILMENI